MTPDDDTPFHGIQTPSHKPVVSGHHQRRADEVAERISGLISRDDLEVGDRLPSERALAERLGTSRATVSQALRTLSIMGMVEIRPGAGVFVARNPTAMVDNSMDLLVRSHPGSAKEIAQLRYWLETVGAVEAARRLDRSDSSALFSALESMRVAEGQMSRWIIADSRFHYELAKASKNTYLAALYQSVHTATIAKTYDRWISGANPPAWFVDEFDAQMQLHSDLLQAVVDNDVPALLAALERHQLALLAHLGVTPSREDLELRWTFGAASP